MTLRLNGAGIDLERLADRSQLRVGPLELARADELVEEEVATRPERPVDLLEQVFERSDVMDRRNAEHDIVSIGVEFDDVQILDAVGDVREPCGGGCIGRDRNRATGNIDGVMRAREVVLGEPALELAGAAAERQSAGDRQLSAEIFPDEVLIPIDAGLSRDLEVDPLLHTLVFGPVHAAPDMPRRGLVGPERGHAREPFLIGTHRRSPRRIILRFWPLFRAGIIRQADDHEYRGGDLDR